MQTLRLRKESSKASQLRLPTKAIDDKKNRSPGQKLLAATFGVFLVLCLILFVRHDEMHRKNEEIARKKLQGKSPFKSTSKEGIAQKMLKRKSLFKSTSKQIEKKDKKGNVVHKQITSVKKEDLAELVGDLPENLDSITYEQAIEGREKLVEILHDAGVEDMDVATVLSLPKWSAVTKLYGEGPVIVGLETCETFRKTIPLDDASIGTAGMFNTGTNPFAMYLEHNCIMPHNTNDKHGGMRWQVPWGKHTLASRKWTNTAGNDSKVNKTNVLPVAIVRDPYSWMQSTCKHPYAAKWPHTKDRCPNLVPTDEEKKVHNIHTPTVEVKVNYNPPANFDSLAHYWTEWYREYLSADYPRLIVRFEDLQFHAKEMVDLVCQCAGAVSKNDGDFTYIVDSGKWGAGHQGKQTNLISAMIKYGTDKNRFSGMTKEDLELAATVLDPELMKLFQYEIPSV